MYSIMSHIVEDRRKQKITEFILTEWRMSLDCLKQKRDTQGTVEIIFLIFLDIEVKISSISNFPEDLRLIFKEEIWESFA